MEFFRRTFNFGNEEEVSNYHQQICEFGFLNSDTNQPPTYSEFYNYSQANDIYWGEDSLHRVRMRQNTNSNYNHYHFIKPSSQRDSDWNNSYQCNIFSYALGNERQGTFHYTELIFIPLKNKGFSMTNFALASFRPLPPLGIDSQKTNFGNWSYPDYKVPCFLLGIAPTQSSVLNNYIYLYGGNSTPIENNTYYKRLDTQISEFNPISSLGDTASSMAKTNINNNVCTLIQMPYNNYFLDNVFLISTAPQELKECSFFSFGGRNFFNIIDNLVVELPNG